MKSSKFEKRRHSPSPIYHPMSSTPHPMRAPSPYQDERYMGKPMTHQSRFSPPVKKKGRRDTEDSYLRPTSPNLHMMQRSEMPHAVGRIPPLQSGLLPIPGPSSGMKQTQRNHGPQHDRREHYDMQSRDNHSTLPASPSGHSKRPLPSQPKQRVEYAEFDEGPELKLYWAAKEKQHYAPTLNERFAAVSEEPRVKYTREDLEKITIDVHRNSPPRRHTLEPLKLKVRRMFDRDEIKHAPRDMREEAYFEKTPANEGLPRYEVKKFDPAPTRSMRGRSPGDRWQREDAGAAEGGSMDRDHREYEKPAKKRFVDTRSKSGDQDFRSGKYSRDASRERPEYHDVHHRMPSPEHRNSVPIHHKEQIQDARERLTSRRGSAIKPQSSHSDTRGRYPSESEKHYFEAVPPRTEKHYKDHPSPEAHKWVPKRRSDSRERMPEYSRPSEKYRQKSWPEKRDLSPRNTDHYYETGRYAESETYRGRGGSRSFRSREQRGRGSFPSRSFRGGYRGSATGRGRGTPRSGRYSPVWDEFYSQSSDRR